MRHIFTEDELKKLCSFWQNQLKLNNWRIIVGIKNLTEFNNKQSLSEIEFVSALNKAVIKILDPDEYGDIDYIPSKNLSYFWIEGTRRGFVYPDNYICNYYNEEKDEVIVCSDAKFAWTIYTEQLLKISKKYNIDLKIYAFEGGMEFNLDIEVSKGKVIKSEVVEFDNYMWDCIDPLSGG